MRRIDLLCKLLAPLFIAIVDGFSTEIAIIVNFAMNMASVVVEYYAIARIYDEDPSLQEQKGKPDTELPSTAEDAPSSARPGRNVWRLFRKSASDFGFYFGHRAFLPSFAGSLLYLTVLSFGSQMVTYLVASGYTTTYIGIARTISVVFEVLATWVAPWLIARIGPVRAGLWLSNCQVMPLIAGLVVFWVFMPNPLVSATGLVAGTIVSRLGLRGFDLCTQIIVQEVRLPRPPSPSPPPLVRKLLRKADLDASTGSRSGKPWSLLHRRGGLAKRVRAPLVPLNHCLLPTGTVQLACFVFCSRRHFGKPCVYSVRGAEKGASDSLRKTWFLKSADGGTHR